MCLKSQPLLACRIIVCLMCLCEGVGVPESVHTKSQPLLAHCIICCTCVYVRVWEFNICAYWKPATALSLCRVICHNMQGIYTAVFKQSESRYFYSILLRALMVRILLGLSFRTREILWKHCKLTGVKARRGGHERSRVRCPSTGIDWKGLF